MKGRDRGRPHRSAARTFLGSWLLEGIGWFALAESLTRAYSEGFLVLILSLLGFPLVEIVLAWLLYHTVAWFFLYGGYLRIRLWRGVATPVERLTQYRDEVAAAIRRSPSIRIAMLVGSAARGTMNERSDVDLMLVPEPPRFRGVLFVWALRLSSVAKRMPLEVHVVDLERYLRFRLANQTAVVLKRAPQLKAGRERLASDGLLVSFSGIDGSGKTTVARELVRRLRERGTEATYFYGHRPFYRESVRSLSPALLFKGIWRRIGRTSEDFRSHKAAEFALDFLTLVDYVGVQSRLARLRRPGTLLFVDRYVVDVIVYLRSFGPGHQSIEGLLAGISSEPDLALLFTLDPERARERKREEPLQELARVVQDYESLAEAFGLIRIDASGSVEAVCSHVDRVLGELLNAGPSGRGAPS